MQLKIASHVRKSRSRLTDDLSRHFGGAELWARVAGPLGPTGREGGERSAAEHGSPRVGGADRGSILGDSSGGRCCSGSWGVAPARLAVRLVGDSDVAPIDPPTRQDLSRPFHTRADDADDGTEHVARNWR